MTEIRFDPNNKHLLDSSERRMILPPEKILHDLKVKEGDVFVDVGCGTGYFAIPAFNMIGSSGRLIALDVSDEMIKELEGRIKENGLDDIEIKHCETYELPLEDNLASFAFISNVLHEVEDKEKLLKETGRILDTGGRLGIVEWQKEKTEKGPPVEIRLSDDEIKGYLEKLGFTLLEEFQEGENFNIFLAQKKA